MYDSNMKYRMKIEIIEWDVNWKRSIVRIHSRIKNEWDVNRKTCQQIEFTGGKTRKELEREWEWEWEPREWEQ